jgi:hypothetical protein
LRIASVGASLCAVAAKTVEQTWTYGRLDTNGKPNADETKRLAELEAIIQSEDADHDLIEDAEEEATYQPDPTYGKCFRATHKKNDEHSWLPASQDLQDYLDALDKTSTFIATRPDGTPWETEKQMQTAVSNWLKALEREGVVGHGLTLHGLRVSFAAGIRRSTGASPSDIAAALGDRDERMGEHYTRHVEQEARVIRAFPKPKKRAKSAKSKGR